MTHPQVRAVSGYVAAAFSVCGAVIGTFAIQRWIAPGGSLLFFPAIVATAMYFGYGAALLATVLSTLSLGYFFVAPIYSFGIGADDVLRLTAFAAVAVATASMASARRNAEASLRQSVESLKATNAILHRVTEWPVLFGNDAAELTREMLQYAAGVVGAAEVFAIWEADNEPLLFLAAPSRQDVITSHQPDARRALVTEVFSARWHGHPVAARIAEPNPALDLDFAGKNVAAVPFRTGHLTGRVFFAGMIDLTAQNVPTIELVAREVGRSLEHLHLANQIRLIAARQERDRLARDLRDGVLQSLAGIRRQVQGLSSDRLGHPSVREQLSTIEEALANEQSELRSFIDGTRPAPGRNPGEIPV